MFADGSLIDSPLLVNICLTELMFITLAVHLTFFPSIALRSANYLCLLICMHHLLSSHFEERLVILSANFAVIALQLMPHDISNTNQYHKESLRIIE